MGLGDARLDGRAVVAEEEPEGGDEVHEIGGHPDSFGLVRPAEQALEEVEGGAYYQFSAQWANPDTQIHTTYIWLRVNGTDVAGTGSKFDVPSKHGTSDGYLIAAANFYVQLQAGDHVEMWAAADSTSPYMEAYAAQTSPFAMPSIPSVVATLSFVSRLPA